MMTLTLLVLAMVGFIFGESGGEERSGEWSGEKDQQARLSLLMSCILQLANYLLYLTGSVS